MYDVIEETILIVPNSGIKLSLMIRNDEGTFRERTSNDGKKKLKILTSEYLSISYSDKDVYASVSASYLCMDIFKNGLKDCRYFIEHAFGEGKDGYYVIGGMENGFKINDLCNGRSILFCPYVDHDAEKNTSTPGVTIYFSDDIMSFVAYEDFMALVDICLKFDLYTASKMLLNNALMYEFIKNKE